MEQKIIKLIIKKLKFYNSILKKGLKDRNASPIAKINLQKEISNVDDLIEEVKNE